MTKQTTQTSAQAPLSKYPSGAAPITAGVYFSLAVILMAVAGVGVGIFCVVNS